MTLDEKLAAAVLARHPEKAVVGLEKSSPDEVAQTLRLVSPEVAAPVVARLARGRGADVLEAFSVTFRQNVLQVLPQHVAAALLRLLPDERRAAVLDELSPATRRALETLLLYPSNTAGALMDPTVLDLPEDYTVEAAREAIRTSPDRARYNIYVVARDHELVGAINLREIMLADASSVLRDIMVRNPVHLDATLSAAQVVGHPGWREVHALPVVDADGHYIGALRYKTLRQLEAELLKVSYVDADAADALSELFSTGATAVLDALAGPDDRKTS